MKEIIRQYGSVCVAMIIAMTILALISGIGSGISRIYGDSSRGIMEESYIGDSFDSYKNVELPTITCSWSPDLCCGSLCPVEDYIHAGYEDGSSCPVRVYCLMDQEGNYYDLQEAEGKQCFFFQEPGVYEVYVFSTGPNNMRTYARLRLPVNS